MRAKTIGWALVGLAATVLLAGCSGGGGDSDLSRIKGQYRELRKGLENKDIQRVMSVYSAYYLDSGYTYDDVKNDTANLFIDFNDISEDQDFHDISIRGDYAYVTWTETLTGTDAQTGVVRQSVTDFSDILHWEHGNWYIYGNQQAATVGVRAPSRYSPKRLRMAPAKMK
jgi:ketosteroid isomerase-like protein